MSKQAALAFLHKVRASPAIQDEMRAEIARSGWVDNTVVGARHGYAFTKAEADAVFQELLDAGGELSDMELEAVAGGGHNPCNAQDPMTILSTDNQP
jgi:hypothetical protein